MTPRIALPRLLRDGRDALTAQLRSAGAPARAPDPAAAPTTSPGELYERRDRLARQLADLQWDLGGLTYEMAIRDHFRVDVLVRVAAQLQAVDVELAETERLLRLDEAGAAGSCPVCSALHARGAPFCWRCGTALLATTGPSNAAAAEQPTNPATATAATGPEPPDPDRASAA